MLNAYLDIQPEVAAALAAGGVQMALTPTALAGPVRRLALLGVGTELLAMHRLEEHLTDLGIDEPVRTGTAGGRLRLAKGLAIAGGLGTLLAGRSRILAVAAGAALATASALTRMGVVEAGIESAKDPRYTVRVQRDRLERRPPVRRRRVGVVEDTLGVQECAHVVEGETERLHPPDHEQPIDVGPGVQPEAPGRASGRDDQTDLVVVADRLDGQPGFRCHRADLQVLGGVGPVVGHDLSSLPGQPSPPSCPLRRR